MTDLIDPEFISTLWPTLNEMTYINNAATGIPPLNTFNAMREYLDNKAQAFGTFKETLSNLKEVRQLLAQLLGGDYSQYAFVPSTSAGINSFAHSINYPKGSNIVLCDLEFPANYVPWQNVKKLYEVELRVVESVDGAVSLDAFKEHIDENTKVVAVSQIQFGTGFRADLEGLTKVAHVNGALLSVDIIQAAGCFETDLAKLGVDFATGQAAKWLLGPVGAGYIFVGSSIMDEVQPRFMGWWGVEQIMEFDYFERAPLSDARKFQVGSPAMIAYVGFLESLKTLLKIQGKKREQAAMDNADYLRKRLTEIDIPYYDFGPDHNSATVSCQPPDVDRLHEELIKNKVFTSVRNGRLRVSPHFYNNHKDIDTLVRFLE
ncbi:MAG: aminotransferase class V-fold PLP-dependent enzyme [Candidatus Thorarchaeota archaeon]